MPKTQMPHSLSSKANLSLLNIFFIAFSIFQCNEVASEAQHSLINIGAIIDSNTRIGREENIAMAIATEELNKVLGNKINLVLHVNDSSGKPLQASRAAEYLLKEKEVRAILGMETWLEAVSVAEVSQKAEVPVLGFPTSLITLPQMLTKWPFLVRMANNDYQEMRCVASIVGSYQWRKVIVIYEHNGYSSESGIQALLSDELRDVGSEIEYWLAFPLLSSLSDPKSYIGEELEKLDNKISRVFIVIGCSLESAFHIVTEAKDIGLMGKHSVWITTTSVTNSLHSANSSVISSMQGIIGIKNHFSITTPNFLNFSKEFTKRIERIYPEEKSKPGIHALRAYDTVTTTASALARLTNNSQPTSEELLRSILSSNFRGLSGEIQFNNGESSQSSTYEIVNVAGLSFEELKFWSSEYGFSDIAIDKMSTQDKNKSRENYVPSRVLGSPVLWPGRLKRIPVGWALPTDAKPMVIGLPAWTVFEKFVMCGETPTGYCIDVFKEAIGKFSYNLPCKFVCHRGTYNQLVQKVYSKEFDAAVGDITILANRSEIVDFTQPYAESGLTMVVLAEGEDKAWLFVKPFTTIVWLLIFSVFVYTMFVVWLLEHRSNPDFKGPLMNQLSTAMWFTFSTLFFAHRESIRSNYTRPVMFVWFCVIYVIATSYQASLTSMLTVQRLKHTVTDIQQLRMSNATVGCNRDSFLRKYLEDIHGFHPAKIINFTDQHDYPKALKNGTISAAILELPNQRVFFSTNPKGYKDTGHKDRFGGLGFAFPIGSPLAEEFSKAFLKLAEDGTLNNLDKRWFPPNSLDSNSARNIEDQRLSPNNFKGLLFLTGTTSTVMLGLYFIFGRWCDSPIDPGNTGQIREANDETHSSRSRNVIHLMSLDAEKLNYFYNPGQSQESQLQEIQKKKTITEVPDNQTRRLQHAVSFPSPNRHVTGVNSVVPLRKSIPLSTSH